MTEPGRPRSSSPSTGPYSAARQRALLQTWFSPAFPIGGFAYSHGLELAAQAGAVQDQTTMEDWIGGLLRYGSPRSDAAFVTAAWRSSRGLGTHSLSEIAELNAALQPSAERYLETTAQGRAFADTVLAAWPAPGLAAFDGLPVIPYPVAAGVAASAHHLEIEATLDAFTLAFVSNQTSAAIRLGLTGQTGGQRIIAALLPEIYAVTAYGLQTGIEAVGTCAFAADIASMRHETQYTRLFRS